ncbi:unnamed protein product [Somion occarium]
MSGVAIVERADIHKSCKSIEAIVNILNDYCEAANAIVTIQKKLAKALRESASTKSTAEFAANALNASATIFESLAEVDSKFVKFADKECDNISAEVKKWFKKLAKEEKAHDERMASANAKIKQAGQLYEKKSKKNPRDAQDEHTRYITLLSSLGPEVAQDKYNHSLNVTIRHTETSYSIAACLSRVADGEWLRSCEGVRRFGPTIGQLGQWRALCEGGWTGPLPQGFQDVDTETPLSEHPIITAPSREQLPQQNNTPETLDKPAPEYTSRGPTPTGTMRPPPNYASQSILDGPSDKHDNSRGRSQSPTSLPSLASFPSPPTHFPLPPVSTSLSSNESVPHGTRESRPDHDTPAESNSPYEASKTTPSHPMPSEQRTFPVSSQASADPTPARTTTKDASDDHQQPADLVSPQQGSRQSSSSNVMPSYAPTRSGENAIVSASTTATTSPSGSRTQPQEVLLDTELGIRRSVDAMQQKSGTSNTKTLERHDTGRSSGSVVANLRDKYIRSAGPPSPGPKEVPRLPLSVSNLAHRYETSGNNQVAPPRSPSEGRRRVSSDLHVRPHNVQSYDQPGTSSQTSSSNRSPIRSKESDLLKQPIVEARESELQEREHQLRLREHEILESSKELERQRIQLQHARHGLAVDSINRYPITDRPQVESPSSSPLTRPQQLHSYSSTHLPVHTTGTYNHSPSSRSPISAAPSPVLPGEHAPYCGCEACSASQYRARDAPPSPRNPRPLEPPITLRPEKPKGWIRRLSMPVMGNAFSSSDSKKGVGNLAIPSNTAGYRSSLALPDEDGRLRTDLNFTGGYGSRSSVNLVRHR